MATADSSLFPRDLGKDIGIAWLGLCLKAWAWKCRVKDNVGLVSTEELL